MEFRLLNAKEVQIYTNEGNNHLIYDIPKERGSQRNDKSRGHFCGNGFFEMALV